MKPALPGHAQPFVPGQKVDAAGPEGKEVRRIAQMLHDDQPSAGPNGPVEAIEQPPTLRGGPDLMRRQNEEGGVERGLRQRVQGGIAAAGGRVLPADGSSGAMDRRLGHEGRVVEVEHPAPRVRKMSPEGLGRFVETAMHVDPTLRGPVKYL